MGNALLGDISRDTTVQYALAQDDLWRAVPVLFEDGMGVTFHVAKNDEH